MKDELLEAIEEIDNLQKRYNLHSEFVLTLQILKICELNKIGYKEMVEKITRIQSNNDNKEGRVQRGEED